MLGQAWEQFFSKGPLLKNLHSTQELQNKQPQLTSAGAETLSPGFGYSWVCPSTGRACLHLPGILGIPAVPSVCITHMYLPQGEGQPGHSWQKGGWYCPQHWQRLQWQVPRRLHTCPRVLMQPSVDCWHWQALPSYPGRHLHTPQSHCPRAAGEDLSDPADSQVTLPLPMLGEHHPPCARHTTLHGMLKEVLQAGVVGPSSPKPSHWGYGTKRQHLPGHLILLSSGQLEKPSQAHHLGRRRGSRRRTRSSCCRTGSRCRRCTCQACRWCGRRTARTRSPPAPSRSPSCCPSGSCAPAPCWSCLWCRTHSSSPCISNCSCHQRRGASSGQWPWGMHSTRTSAKAEKIWDSLTKNQ